MFSSIKISTYFILILFLSRPYMADCQTVELANSDFESGLEFWQPFVEPHCQISLSDDAFSGASSCLVSNRNFFWAGLTRNLQGQLLPGRDYKFSIRTKSATSVPTILKVEVVQTDGEGTRYLEVGKVFAQPDSWSLFEGGFNLQVSGKLTGLAIKIAGDYDYKENFLVDEFAIEQIDWRDAANERIEILRKSDLKIRVTDQQNTSLGSHPVSIQQIRNEFAFGSTMNEAVVNNLQYQQVFRDLFEWATFEWRAQWFPVEFNQGTEDYSLADSTLEFCRQNDIRLRGHAIAWSNPQFVPPWLPGLDDDEMADELDDRIESVVERYQGQLASWDVCNEMLAHDFFQDRLGPSIRPHLFRRARLFDSQTPLFTNEFGIITSAFDTLINNYKSLIQELADNGADVGGIGIQGHFNGNVSPYNIGRGISELATLDLPIWISEYDSVVADPSVRAEHLENLYRYAFSRPEVDGIVMWGFWAGTHWRGPDAAIIDIDWQWNEAGERYLDLRNEWQTSIDTSSDADAIVQIRGFHGTYLVTSPHPTTGNPTYHLLSLPSNTSLTEIELSIPDTDRCLTVYGSLHDDSFELEYGELHRINMNGQSISLPESVEINSVRIIGGDGFDTLAVDGHSSIPFTYQMHCDHISTNFTDSQIEFDQVEQVSLTSQRLGETANLFDQEGGFDLFISEWDQSAMAGPDVELVAKDFSTVEGHSSSNEKDIAVFMATEGPDQVRCDNQSMRVTMNNGRIRRSQGFAFNQMQANDPTDRLVAYSPQAGNSIQLTPAVIKLGLPDSYHCLQEFKNTLLIGAANNSDSLQIIDSARQNESVTIRPNYIALYRGHIQNGGFRITARNFNSSEVRFSGSGNDVLRITGTTSNDTAIAEGNKFELTSMDASHFCESPDRVQATANGGELDQLIENTPNYVLQLFGNWN